MKYTIVSILGFCLTSGLTSGAYAAEPLPEACIASHAASRDITRGSLVLSDYTARLTNTSASLRAAGASLNDPAHKLDNALLTNANTVSALGALALVHGKLPQSCNTADGRPALRALLAGIQAGAQPQLTWHGVTLQEKEKVYTIRTVRIALKTGPTPDSVRITADSSGISSPSGQFVPQTATTDLTLPLRTLSESAADDSKDITLVQPGETMTVNALHATLGSSSVDGHGIVQPGHDTRDTHARLHLEIANMGNFLEELKARASAGVTTALAMAQFMGHRDGDRVSWDVAMDRGIVSVNNFPLPIPLQ